MVDAKAETDEVFARLILNKTNLPIFFVVFLKVVNFEFELPLAAGIEGFDVDLVKLFIHTQLILFGKVINSFIRRKQEVVFLVNLCTKIIYLQDLLSLSHQLRKAAEALFGHCAVFSSPYSTR